MDENASDMPAPIKTLISEIFDCLDHELWRASLVLACQIPDICTAVESDLLTDKTKYKTWVKRYLQPHYDSRYFTESHVDFFYEMRYGVAHTNTGTSTTESDSLYTNIAFTVPGNQIQADSVVIESNTDKGHRKMLVFSLGLHAEYTEQAVSSWWVNSENKSAIAENSERLLQKRVDFLQPELPGVTVIA